MARVKNPRRTVIETLHGVSRRLRETRDLWEFHGRKTFYPAPGAGGPRPREAHEYPETQAAWWGDLHSRLHEEIGILMELRDRAAVEFYKIQKGEH
jgi:hypothetical protein